MFNVPGNAGKEVECSEGRGRGCQRDHGAEWLRAKLSFKVLRSALLCVRESKKAWYKKRPRMQMRPGDVKISQLELWA